MICLTQSIGRRDRTTNSQRQFSKSSNKTFGSKVKSDDRALNPLSPGQENDSRWFLLSLPYPFKVAIAAYKDKCQRVSLSDITLKKYRFVVSTIATIRSAGAS